MSQEPAAVLQRLLLLVQELYAETAGLVASESDLQLWYNRGYENGMIHVLRAKGHGQRLHGLVDIDPQDLLSDQQFLPWGKAYQHGFEMGEQETREVL
ncbi:MAG: hypothetical protein QNJ78_07815 [Gammaproteobacteria bacterium]|nr:hypothetical protein [Gammaproteobacteria bacterium]